MQAVGLPRGKNEIIIFLLKEVVPMDELRETLAKLVELLKFYEKLATLLDDIEYLVIKRTKK